MLEQQRADELMQMIKLLVKNTPIEFPMSDDYICIEARSKDRRESFIFDVNRKGEIKTTKCTFQERHANTEILLRLDIDGPPHTNPDGTEIPCPHLHIYKEGFGTKWAYTLPSNFNDSSDLVNTFREFLKYAKVQESPQIQRGID